MVLAIFMAVGAWRLAQHNVLVRRAAAVETLGAINFLCVDKTGTLTENRITVATIWTDGRMHRLDDQNCNTDIGNVLTMAALSSAVHPVDPMDVALRALVPSVHQDNAIADEMPLKTRGLQPDSLAVINVWRALRKLSSGSAGCPSSPSETCSPQSQQAEKGLRVLGVASRVGALFQITTPPLPVLVLTIAAGTMAGSWYGVGKVFSNSRLLTSWTAGQAGATDSSN